MLAPIALDETVMTVPIIDGVDHKTFEYRPVYTEGHHFRGIFEWVGSFLLRDLGRLERFCDVLMVYEGLTY